MGRMSELQIELQNLVDAVEGARNISEYELRHGTVDVNAQAKAESALVGFILSHRELFGIEKAIPAAHISFTIPLTEAEYAEYERAQREWAGWLKKQSDKQQAQDIPKGE